MMVFISKRIMRNERFNMLVYQIKHPVGVGWLSVRLLKE